jgi:hypothetical protein
MKRVDFKPGTEKPVNGFRFLKISVSGVRTHKIQVVMSSKQELTFPE